MLRSKNHPIRFIFITILSLALLAGSSIAQEPEATPEVPPYQGITVEIEAADGLTLVGRHYAPPSGDGPVVVLLHQLYTNSDSWEPLIGPLWANGYHVVAVDIRGHGRSRGAISWSQAQEDTLTWLEWLVTQPGMYLDAIHLVGSSMGANLALNGCAAATHCNGVVAISPGLHYFGVYTEDAITSGRPIFIIYAERDYYPARDVPLMEEMLAEQDLHTLAVTVYPGNAHGIDLFAEEDLAAVIIDWLNQ